MGWLGATQFTLLLVAVALAGATGGFIASRVARRNKRRRRGVFLVGFFCGAMAVAVARRQWHAAVRLVVRPLGAAVFPAALGLPPRWQPRQLRTSLAGLRR